MRFFKKFAAILGFAKDDTHEHDSNDDAAQPRPTPPYRVQETGLPRQGFGVPAQVVVDRPQLGPVLAPSTSGDGGVQGLRWYAKRLRVDEDGDVADVFLEEVSSETPAVAAGHHKTAAKFRLNDDTKPVKVKKQVLLEGKLQHCVEHRGKLQLDHVPEALNFNLVDANEVKFQNAFASIFPLCQYHTTVPEDPSELCTTQEIESFL